MAQSKSRAQKLNGIPSLAYLGVLPSSPANFFIEQRPPTVNDYRNCYIGDVWLDNSSLYLTPPTSPTAENLWILVSVSNHIAVWINFESQNTLNLACGFLYVQGSNVADVTGDGTIYSLGASQALTQIFDVHEDVTPGNGLGTPAVFTAPFSGMYYLQMGAQFTNMLAGVFNNSIATYNVVTPERTFTSQFSPLGSFQANAMVSDSGSFEQGFFVNLSAGDQVTFSCMTNVSEGAGVRDIGVGGSTNPVQTFIAGFVLGGGNGGGIGTVKFLEGNSGGPVGPIPASGIINVIGDGTTITVAGNSGDNTLTISAVGGTQPGTSCCFLAIQESNASNVTGDGTTYSLGSSVALTTIFDIGANVYVGSGAGAPATFTAPATGTYWLNISILLYNMIDGVFDNSVGIYTITTPERSYVAEFSPLGMFQANAMVSDAGSFTQGFLVNLAFGDVVTFSCQINASANEVGARIIGVAGQANPASTFISGYIVSGGGGGGVTTVSAGNNIVFTGADIVHNPIINVVSSPTFSGLTVSSLSSGVVQTDGSGVFSSSEGTDGQLLISSSAGSPAWANIVAGSGIDIVNGNNSITIATTNTSGTFTSVTTTPYVALDTDEFLGVTTSALAITVELPNAPATGRIFTVKDSTGDASTNNITVTTVGDTIDIDGATTYVMATDYQAISLIFDGTNYEVY